MKNFLIVLALALVLVGVYWKFGGKIGSTVEEVKKSTGEKGSPFPALADAAKSVTGGGGAEAEVKLPLVDSSFIRGLPDSLANYSGSTKPDVVLEITGSEPEAGKFPPQIQLTPNVWLDTNSLNLAGDASANRPGSKVLVHLQSVSPSDANASPPQQLVQGVAEALPGSLDSGLGKTKWRNSLPMPATSSSAPPHSPYLWATAFEDKSERGDLHGVAHVEGTFGSYKKGAANAIYDIITLEECKKVQFYFSRGSIWEANVAEADKLKKQGNKVTIRMTIDLDTTPKYLAQAVNWGIPLKDKSDYWKKTIGGTGKFSYTLAYAAWAESRNMKDEAQEAYAKAHNEVVKESVLQLGKSTKGIRIHLSDEVDDHWFYEIRNPVSEGNHHPVWKGKPVDEEFFGLPHPACVVFRTNSKGESKGDFYLIQE